MTLSHEQDRFETFVSRIREALAMPKIPEEQDDRLDAQLREDALRQVRPPTSSVGTSPIGLNDASVSTDSQGMTASTPSINFLSAAQRPTRSAGSAAIAFCGNLARAAWASSSRPRTLVSSDA